MIKCHMRTVTWIIFFKNNFTQTSHVPPPLCWQVENGPMIWKCGQRGCCLPPTHSHSALTQFSARQNPHTLACSVQCKAGSSILEIFRSHRHAIWFTLLELELVKSLTVYESKHGSKIVEEWYSSRGHELLKSLKPVHEHDIPHLMAVKHSQVFFWNT